MNKQRNVCYEKNFALLEKRHPALALQMRMVPERSLPLKLEKTPPPFDRDETEVLYLYGLEGAGAYEALLLWLSEKETRRVIFVEDDLSLLPLFLRSKCAQEVLKDSQVRLCFLGEAPEEALKEVVWPHLFAPVHFTHSTEERAERGEIIHALFSELKIGAELTVSLYRDFGMRHVRNVCANLLKSQNVRRGEEWKEIFRGIPAVICGAGPSLAKSIPLLKKMSRRALFFAGGSALNTLSFEGVSFHFGGSIDPKPPPYRFMRQTAFEIPFFYQNRLDHDFFMQVHGVKCCFGGGQSSAVEEWLLESLGLLLPPFDAGWNVSTFLTHVAAHLGCSPIIFVGMDFSKSKGEVYSKGVEQIEEGAEHKRKDPLAVTDRFGRRVYTRPDFLMGKKWIEAFCAAHPDIEFFDSTAAGLRIEGIPEETLNEVFENRLKKKIDLDGLIHRAVQTTSSFSVDPAIAREKIGMIEKSMKRCALLCEELFVQLGRNRSQSYREEQYALQNVELEEELFYRTLLMPLWQVWRHLLEKGVSPYEKKLQEILFFKEVLKHAKRALPI